MKNWKVAQFKDVAQIYTGKTPSTANPEYYGNSIPFVSPADLNNSILNTSKNYLSVLGADQVCRVPKDTVLVSCIGYLGKVAIVNQEVCFNQQLNALVFDKNKIFPKYGFYYAQTIGAQLEKLSSSTTVPIVNKSRFSTIEIKYPDIDEQRRIASILDKADDIRQKRQQAIAKLDELLQAKFIDMFGDPVSNPKGWKFKSLKEFGTFKNGLNYGKGESGVTRKYIGVGNFKNFSKLDDIDSLGSIELNQEPSQDYFLKDGDLLFVRSNGNKELVGRCIAVYPRNELVTYSGFCIRYRIEKEGLTPEFISHLFKSESFRSSILKAGQGANIQNINQQSLGELKIPVPSEDLLVKWSNILNQVERQKSLYSKELEHSLFSSLQQKAFNGTL